MKKYIIKDNNSSQITGKQVFLKADNTQTLNFDYAHIYPEVEAINIKEHDDNLELIEVNVVVV
ncbi:hypothetical protein [Peribacillus huizhouensis]|uniref:Bacillus phage SPbeta YonK domain-containing protein n=1 Tax=Peribacillus huizhouensis TaxID=1501239 RepID=A0ABR6CRG9_9BACI|nr:hypothetical protein [Peribacillus huizhouensis]MBA9027622.1 hypothetical protein [Peribacillus huizhouensis]